MLSVIVFILLGILLVRVVKPSVFSPVYFSLGFMIIALVLSTAYFHLYTPKFSLYRLDEVDATAFYIVIQKYIGSLNAFLGAILSYYFCAGQSIRQLLSSPLKIQIKIDLSVGNSTRFAGIGLTIFLMVFFLFIYRDALFYRAFYIPELELQGLLTIHKVLTFFAVILLGILYKDFKWTSISLFTGLILLYLGTGSRSLIVFFVLYIAIAYLGSPKRLLQKIKLSLSFVFLFVFLSYLIRMRGLPSHGLVPYFTYIFSFDIEVIETSLFNIYYMFIFGVYVTIETLQRAGADWGVMLVNLNPAPGTLAGWYEIAQERRINRYAPYSLHGEVFAMGTAFTIIFFFILGLLFAYFDMRIRQFFRQRNYFSGFVLIIILALHVFYAYEYNMRSSLRFIYYAIGYLCLVFITHKILLTLKRYSRHERKR